MNTDEKQRTYPRLSVFICGLNRLFQHTASEPSGADRICPDHPPDQFRKGFPSGGVAVSTTALPSANLAEQYGPQFSAPSRPFSWPSRQNVSVILRSNATPYSFSLAPGHRRRGRLRSTHRLLAATRDLTGSNARRQ